MRARPGYEFACPNPECDFVAPIGWVPDGKIDPGYLDGDPPEECPDCGADMTDADGERCDLNDYVDWDAIGEMRADAAYDR